jgi:[ribosomal protein S5]-alanine N-acetyltransferase
MAIAMLRVQTERLELLALTPELAADALRDKTAAAKRINADIPPGWPPSDLLDFLPYYVRDLKRDSSLVGWGIWVIVHNIGRVVIGDIGFKGKPENGTIEIGYGILPAYQQQGYATEASRALIAWAWMQPDVERVTAACLDTNAASRRVLEKIGMRRTGKSGGLIYWEIMKS